jgi:hypothetical protein
MTNRFLAGVAFAALVISVLSLFVALSNTDVQPTGTAADVVAATTTADGRDEPTVSPLPTTTADTPADAATPSATVVTATTAAATAPTATTTPDTALPGTPAAFGPAAGTQLGVIGVAHDDWLNVRDVPNGDVVATLTLQLSPRSPAESALLVRDAEAEAAFARIGVAGVTATGRSRDLATSTWHEIQAGPIVGWASSNYLAPLSPESALDITAQVITDIDGPATAETFAELVDQVVATVASDEPRSRVRTTSAPDPSGDLLDVAVDVVGQPDDSVRGYRLLIVVQMAADIRALDADGGGDFTTDLGPYTLRSVLATPLCYSHRGISTDGVCN